MFGAKKNFGFGCMRLQMDGNEVDLKEFTRMVDAFMDAGFKHVKFQKRQEKMHG